MPSQDATPGELAEQFGRLLKLATDNMKQLLEGRQQAKRLARSTNQTAVPSDQQQPTQVRANRGKTPFASCLVFQGQSYLDAERERSPKALMI